ncbi:unnamed protein product [Brachionus calyciflorus]|uniref:Transmembrane protein 177 n=1 Tax=Brachionus calyciflorus TaxID=104777 RepID=A0A813M7A1_9BILA|nr:unnamed protein product [Brachionus calyciflorus]
MYRFLRENSQFIAATLVAGYVGTSVTYKINKGDLLRENYEFLTKKNTYLGLSIKEEENAKKFLYRLNDYEKNYEFFRSNTLDFISFGFNKTRNGAQIGLPLSYFANSKSEICELIPENGFEHFLGQTISLENLNQKLTSEQIENFNNSLILSQDAKLFALAREVANTQNFFRSIIENIIEFSCLFIAYWFSYVFSRGYKFQYLQRKRLYVFSGLTALSIIFSSKLITKKILEESNDSKACQMGLDCCEGSIEFYDKELERNRLLRLVLPDGEKLIDSEGNIMKQSVHLPFTNYYFYMNNTGIKLTERRENCRKELIKMIQKLSDQFDAEQTKKFQESTESIEESTNNKELKIFKAIRLQLENLSRPK